jgi:hypothetical protein
MMSFLIEFSLGSQMPSATNPTLEDQAAMLLASGVVIWLLVKDGAVSRTSVSLEGEIAKSRHWITATDIA